MTQARKIGEEDVEELADRGKHKLTEIKEQGSELATELSDLWDTYTDQMRAQVRKHPIAVVAGCFFAGYLIAALFTRGN